jgi:hypothetical protein
MRRMSEERTSRSCNGPTCSWPSLPLGSWSETCATLHLWTQIVGKVRMTLTPLVNHWWNVTLYVTARGLTTSPIPCGTRTFEIAFDFLQHCLIIQCSDGGVETLKLAPMAVADFYRELMCCLQRLDIAVHIWSMPSEIENAVPFDQDRVHAQYDPDYAQRFWCALVQSDRVMKDFRARFIGKASPVHFFWGSFDLAVTRFSGRRAPPPTGTTPNVASWVMAEAYSHEVSSCGFWPGNGGYGQAAYYAYAYLEPPDYGKTALRTPGASYDTALGQFILPYETVRQSADPDALLLGFLQETYAAAATLAHWDRAAFERAMTRPPRSSPRDQLPA